jgi:hypothetical protein
LNATIEDIKAMDIGDRIELFNVCFDELTELNTAAADGYVRQSVLRVADELVPGIVAPAALENEDRSIGADAADIRDQTDLLCGFLQAEQAECLGA